MVFPAMPVAMVVGKVTPLSVLRSRSNVCPAPRVWVQATTRVLPIAHTELPVGSVTLTVPEMVKLTALTLAMVGSVAEEMRTRALVVAGVVTTQLKVPVVSAPLGTFAAIELQVAPPSRLTSMSTVAAAPRLWVQVIDRVLPIVQVTAVLGAVMVMRSMIAKFTGLALAMAGFPDQRTRARAAAVGGPETTQGTVPVVALVVTNPAFTVSQLAPPSRLTSTATLWPVPRLWLNVTFCVLPILQVTAVTGAVRVSEAAPLAMVKLALEVADAVRPTASRTVTRMRPVVLTGPGASQVQVCAVPGNPVHSEIAAKLAPPSEEKATSTPVTATLSVAVHCRT